MRTLRALLEETKRTGRVLPSTLSPSGPKPEHSKQYQDRVERKQATRDRVNASRRFWSDLSRFRNQKTPGDRTWGGKKHRVDEISRETLERYGDRARASHRKLARAVDDSERRYGGENDAAAHPRAYANYQKKHKKMVARETGIRRANDRLVGHPGTLDYHWGRPKPSRRTKSGQHVAYHQESVLEAVVRNAGSKIAGMSTRRLQSMYHSGKRTVSAHPDHPRTAEVRRHLKTIDAELRSRMSKLREGESLGEMSYRLLDRYVRRAEGDPRRAQGLARARVRLDLKRINFRDPMREDAAGAPVVDADKQARALRLKRLLAMASQAQQGIGDQTKRPVREALAEARTRADHHERWAYDARRDHDHPHEGVRASAHRSTKTHDAFGRAETKWYRSNDPRDDKAAARAISRHYAARREYKATKRSYLEAKKIRHPHGRGLSSFKTKKK